MLSLRNETLWVDPNSSAATTARDYAAKSDTMSRARAFIFGELAKTASAIWLTGSSDEARANDVLTRAAGQLPVFVAYNVVNRDNGSDSSGGAATVTAYKAWVDGLVRGFRGRKCMVIVEPDALPQLGHLSTSKTDRIACLSYAVTAFVGAGAYVYIDVGDSGWTDEEDMLAAAMDCGLSQARGVAHNVAHFRTTADEHAFGQKICDLAKSKHGLEIRYVVDVRRNGAGPYRPSPAQSSKMGWCNPANTKYGARPTLRPSTTYRSCDGLLHVKGLSSDGKMCPTGREGAAPDAGQPYHENVVAVYLRSSRTLYPAVPE